MMLKIWIGVLALSGSAAHALEAVTTTPDLAALVQEVGGPSVKVFAIAKGTQDPHQIEAKPSFMMKMRNADLVVAQGLELESAWLQPLIDGSRNPKIAAGGKGFLELGPQLDPIDIPTNEVTRAHGDVHPGGNPHFQLDPQRMGRAALILAQRMGELEPANAAAFTAAAAAYQKKMTELGASLKTRVQKTAIREVVTYHKTLSYFMRYFGLKNDLQLEPKPGIPPTAGHLLEVSREIKKRGIRLILIENFHDRNAAAKITQEIPGVKIVSVPVAVGGEPELKTTAQLLERLVKIIEDASR